MILGHLAQIQGEYVRMASMVDASVYYGRDVDPERSWQAPFPSELSCEKCGRRMVPLFQVYEDERTNVVAKKPPLDGQEIWPHDATASVVYWCTSCGNVDARFNQA